MRWFSLSATTITPLEGITATPVGPLKLAAAPVPSANAPLPLPASVVTTPTGVTSRMRWLPKSATTITPLEAITAISLGLLKLADWPVPSANAPVPLPTKVLAAPLFGAGAAPPTTSASACGDAPAAASPAAPHSSTAA